MGFPRKRIHICLMVTLWIGDHFPWKSSSHCLLSSACVHQVHTLMALGPLSHRPFLFTLALGNLTIMAWCIYLFLFLQLYIFLEEIMKARA